MYVQIRFEWYSLILLFMVKVFVMVNCSVQFQVIKEKVYQSFYSLSHSEVGIY